jgi:hypothetical protein
VLRVTNEGVRAARTLRTTGSEAGLMGLYRRHLSVKYVIKEQECFKFGLEWKWLEVSRNRGHAFLYTTCAMHRLA